MEEPFGSIFAVESCLSLLGTSWRFTSKYSGADPLRLCAVRPAKSHKKRHSGSPLGSSLCFSYATSSSCALTYHRYSSLSSPIGRRCWIL